MVYLDLKQHHDTINLSAQFFETQSWFKGTVKRHHTLAYG